MIKKLKFLSQMTPCKLSFKSHTSNYVLTVGKALFLHARKRQPLATCTRHYFCFHASIDLKLKRYIRSNEPLAEFDGHSY